MAESTSEPRSVKLDSILPKRFSIYAVVGDSLAEEMKEQYVQNILSPNKGYILNYGVGEASSDIMNRIIKVNPPKGSTILVFMGTNDLIKIGRGMIIPPQVILASLKENINALAEFSEDRKIQIILTTIPPCTKYRSPWNAKLAMPAATLNAMQEYNAWLLHKRWDNIRVLDLSPFAERGKWGNGMKSDLTRDGLHPNSNGYMELAKMLVKMLKPEPLNSEKKRPVATVMLTR